MAAIGESNLFALLDLLGAVITRLSVAVDQVLPCGEDFTNSGPSSFMDGCRMVTELQYSGSEVNFSVASNLGLCQSL